MRAGPPSTLDLRPTCCLPASRLGLPAAGKTMLARRLPTMLPAMTLAKTIDTTRILRVDGRTAVVTTPPFCPSHHTVSDVGLIGGARHCCEGNL